MAKADFDIVRKIGRGFPGVEESTCFGKPALKVGGKMFACMASHRSAEPGSLVVRVDFPRREELLAEAPEVYYVTDHYIGYSSVLVKLERIRADALRGLLAGAMEFVKRGGGRRAGWKQRTEEFGGQRGDIKTAKRLLKRAGWGNPVVPGDELK